MPAPSASLVDPIPPQPPLRRRRRWGRRIGLTLLLLLLVSVGLHWLWGKQEAKKLATQLAGYRGAGEPVTVEELNRWPATTSGSGENAVPLLRATAATVQDLTPAYKAYMDAQRRLPLTDEEVKIYQAVLKENEKALTQIDEVTTKPRIDWELAYQSPMISHLGQLQDLNGLRRLTNLLHADALLAHQHGDPARALKRAGQILFISRATGHQPTLVAYLVSLGMSAQAATLVAEISPDLPAADAPARQGAKALIAQLLDEQSVAETRRRALVGERVLQLDTVSSLTQGKLAHADLRGGRGDDGDGTRGAKATAYVMRPIFFENGRAMAAHMTAMVAATAQSPDWPAYQAKAPQSRKTADWSVRNMLLQIMLPSLDRAIMSHFRCIGERRLAAVCLAARLYAADHDGRLPASLQDLVPDYLPSVPLDPFAGGGKALGYINETADAKDPRVYGVGENGIDNGGIEIDPTAPRAQTKPLEDEIRHLKRQPRPKPVDRSRFYPGYPGAYPGFPGPPPGFPGAPPSDEDEVEDEAAGAKTTDADEPAGDTPTGNGPPGGGSPTAPSTDSQPRGQP